MAAISQTLFWNAFSWMKMWEFVFSLKFVPKGSINNIPSLVQVMAWRRPGDKPLSEPTLVSLLTHIYASLGLNELNETISKWIQKYLTFVTMLNRQRQQKTGQNREHVFFVIWVISMSELHIVFVCSYEVDERSSFFRAIVRYISRKLTPVTNSCKGIEAYQLKQSMASRTNLPGDVWKKKTWPVEMNPYVYCMWIYIYIYIL